MFQFGDFYNQTNDWANIFATLFGSVIGAAISGIIAIIIFKRGINEQKKKESNQIKEKTERNVKTFILQLENIVKFLNHQTLEFDNYNNKISKDSLSLAIPLQVPSNELKRIFKTDTNEIIELFQYRNLFDNEYLTTINSLDYIYIISKQWPKDIISYNKNTIEDLTNKIMVLKREIDDLITDNIEHSNPILQNIILNNQKEFLKEPGRTNDLSYCYNNFYQKFYKELLELINKETSLFYFNLLKKTKICIDILYTISEFNKSFAKKIYIINDKYQEVSNNLVKVISKLKQN